jgi:hypothetical protein
MPKLSNKHGNAELVMFSDFTGGLNLMRPPEAIADNEMQTAVNLEFAPDSGILRIRDGIERIYTFPQMISDIIPVPGTKTLLIRSGSLYKLEDRSSSAVGQVDGDKPVSYEMWGESGQMIMSFGARLQIRLYEEIDRRLDTAGSPPRPVIFGGDPSLAAASYDGNINGGSPSMAVAAYDGEISGGVPYSDYL